MSGPAARIFAGTSGWAYPTWKPGFYPADVPAKKFLSYYASQLTSVEVNYTFGSTLKPGQLEGWLESTPGHFRFSFKAPQRITHFSRLRECEAALEAFFAALEPARSAGKMGVVLFQLPPNFKCDLERLHTFLSAPGLRQASAPRIAFEFRHESWFCGEQAEAVRSLLGKHDAALCIAESDALRSPEWHTAAGHSCFRLRRNGGYKPRELTAFARRFSELAAERDVFVYFKHEDEPTGALNAVAFLKALRRPRT